MLRAVPASASLATLERAIHEAEDGTYLEMISLAAAVIDGEEATVVALRPHAAEGRVTLVEVDGAASLPEQEIEVCARRERGGRRLLAYAAVWVGGRRVNVAAYRS